MTTTRTVLPEVTHSKNRYREDIAERSKQCFQTIDLAELNALASRLNRIDRKYVVPVQALPQVMGAVKEAHVLNVGGQTGLEYASSYMDTPELLSYHLAGRKRRRRFKVRIRRYQNGAQFLEVKTRDGRGFTCKQRQPYAGTGQLGASAHEFIEQCLRDSGIQAPVSTLQPTLSTRYRRVTLYLPHDQARATIDMNLTCENPAGQVSLDHVAIVETKGGNRATELDRWMRRHGHRQVRISKYGVGMAVLTPGLPPEKWYRTLSHTLDISPGRGDNALNA